MKIKFLIGVVIICTGIISCEKSIQPPKPEGLIPKEKMQDVLYDMFIINSAKGVNNKLLEYNGLNPEEYILNKYNIDSLQFAKSNEYYAYDIDEYQDIISEVKHRITDKKSELEKLEAEKKEIEKKRRDSLRKINAKKKINGNNKIKPKIDKKG